MPLSTEEQLSEVPDGLVTQFRNQFLEQYKKEIQTGVFDKRDVEDMLDEPRIRMYLCLAVHDLKVALRQTRDMFVWRNDYKVRNVKLSDFPPTLLRGAMFYRNKDLEGNNIFWFRVRFNKKGQLSAERKKFFAYLLEQHYQKFRGERVTFVFDMTDCGLTQADLDVLRFQINCLQHYFPFIVNNLLVYKMPWVFEGIWKIVKTWLPTRSQERVKFVSGDAIDAFISRENRFTHMGGGMDTFADMHGDGDAIFLTMSDLYTGTPRTMGYHNASFISVSALMADSSSLSPTIHGRMLLSPSQGSSLNTPPASPMFEQASEAAGLDDEDSGSSTPTQEKKSPRFLDPPLPVQAAARLVQRSVSSNEPLLEFTPDSTPIIFEKTSTSNEIIEASIYLRNVSGAVVAFKIKSTSMTRYRSRPCAGFIQPGHSRHIHISCRFADRGYLSGDRFLIQYASVQESNIDSSAPPAACASKLLYSRPPGEKLFEKRLIPTASPTLPPVVMNGNVGNGELKTHNSTPTPPLLTNSREHLPKVSEAAAVAEKTADKNDNDKASNNESSPLLGELGEKLLSELATQRRLIRYLIVVVTLQMFLFFAYVVVFQAFPDEFHGFVKRNLKGLKNATANPDL